MSQDQNAAAPEPDKPGQQHQWRATWIVISLILLACAVASLLVGVLVGASPVPSTTLSTMFVLLSIVAQIPSVQKMLDGAFVALHKAIEKRLPPPGRGQSPTWLERALKKIISFLSEPRSLQIMVIVLVISLLRNGLLVSNFAIYTSHSYTDDPVTIEILCNDRFSHAFSRPISRYQ